jgi:hypothetical protein
MANREPTIARREDRAGRPNGASLKSSLGADRSRAPKL